MVKSIYGVGSVSYTHLDVYKRQMEVKEPKELDPFLKQVGILTLSMAVLVAVGLNYF